MCREKHGWYTFLLHFKILKNFSSITARARNLNGKVTFLIISRTRINYLCKETLRSISLNDNRKMYRNINVLKPFAKTWIECPFCRCRISATRSPLDITCALFSRYKVGKRNNIMPYVSRWGNLQIRPLQQLQNTHNACYKHDKRQNIKSYSKTALGINHINAVSSELVQGTR